MPELIGKLEPVINRIAYTQLQVQWWEGGGWGKRIGAQNDVDREARRGHVEGSGRLNNDWALRYCICPRCRYVQK